MGESTLALGLRQQAMDLGFGSLEQVSIMSIIVGRYTFEGPYTDTSSLADRSGVYAIHCYRDGGYYLVDAGESANVKSRVDIHDRKQCWAMNCSGTLTVSVLYTPNAGQAQRRLIEQELRVKYGPPCGSR